VTELRPIGPFSLRAAAEFGFGPNQGQSFDGTMRLAFAVDGGDGHIGAVLSQATPDGPVTVDLQTRGGAQTDRVLAQLARILSLDQDGEDFLRVGERDSVIARLQHQHRGQRPVLFHSPYEAAAWSIISARRPAAQSARVRAEIGERLGATFKLAGQTVHAFPQPKALAGLPDEFPGLNAEKLSRLRGIAGAALAGDLDVERIQALGSERAYEEIQRLKGLGPFYAGLVVLRASGFADAMLQVPEPRVLSHAARFYGPDSTPSLEWLTQIAEPWRPFRTWCTVLIRLAGDRAAAEAG
jgi:DNA-3-methyladenine glycosylase II